jgi:hypothetical protein
MRSIPRREQMTPVSMGDEEMIRAEVDEEVRWIPSVQRM